MTMRPVLVVLATMDPRGNKIGGIETHIRHILRNHPTDIDLLLVGIDEFGDLSIGKPLDLRFDSRAITFVPVAHVPAEEARISARRLLRSTTLRFVAGGMRHARVIRRLIAGRPASADLPRVEFAALARLLGLPYALTIHSDLGKAGKTESLLKRYGNLKRLSETIAFAGAARVFAVNSGMLESLRTAHPVIAGKSGVLPVPVDTRLFRPSPFPDADPFRIVYAGRFEEVKDPALMFETVRLLGETLGGKLEFHVVGAADPSAYPNFEPIRHLARLHGPRDAAGVAAILAKAHCGILTSHSEGLPCFLLETLAAGRAFVAVDLPVFRRFVHPGRTGELVPRAGARIETAAELAKALHAVSSAVAAGTLAPERIAAEVRGYSVETIFAELFAAHQALRWCPRAPSEAEALAEAARAIGH